MRLSIKKIRKGLHTTGMLSLIMVCAVAYVFAIIARATILFLPWIGIAVVVARRGFLSHRLEGGTIMGYSIDWAQVHKETDSFASPFTGWLHNILWKTLLIVKDGFFIGRDLFRWAKGRPKHV